MNHPYLDDQPKRITDAASAQEQRASNHVVVSAGGARRGMSMGALQQQQQAGWPNVQYAAFQQAHQQSPAHAEQCTEEFHPSRPFCQCQCLGP